MDRIDWEAVGSGAFVATALVVSVVVVVAFGVVVVGALRLWL